MKKPKLKRLVIHADDFGMTRGVTEGILKAIQEGCVTSTSCLVNFPTSDPALEKAKILNIDLGWHINFTLGRPLCDPQQVPSLVQKDGTFYPLIPFMVRSFMGRIRAEDVEKELEAQYQKFSQHKISLSHVDGHQHIHSFPVVRDKVAHLAQKNKLPFVRIPREVGNMFVPRWAARTLLRGLTVNLDFGVSSLPFYGFSLGTQGGDLETWKKLVSRIQEDVAEIMVHPAIFYPDDHYYGDDFPGDRESEWKLLMSEEFKHLAARMGFKLVGFRDLS